MSFLFPAYMAKKLLYACRHYHRIHHFNSDNPSAFNYDNLSEYPIRLEDQLRKKMETALLLFEFEIKQYWGLGFLASFIPGTKAYKARVILSNNTTAIIPIIKNFLEHFLDIRRHHFVFFYRLYTQSQLRGPLLSLLTLGPLWKILDSLLSNLNPIEKVENESFHMLLSRFPIIKYFYIDERDVHHYEGWEGYADNPQRSYASLAYVLHNLIHDFLNPVRLINDALIFLQYVFYRVIDVFDDSYRRNSIYYIRVFFKSLTLCLFSVVRFPFLLLGMITDIPYKILNHFIYQPIKFFYSTIRQAFSDTAKFTMSIDTAEKMKHCANDFRNVVSNKKIALLMGLKQSDLDKDDKDYCPASYLSGQRNLTKLIFDHAFDKRSALDDIDAEDSKQSEFSLCDLNATRHPLSDKLSLFTCRTSDLPNIQRLATDIENTSAREAKVNKKEY